MKAVGKMMCINVLEGMGEFAPLRLARGRVR